MRLMAKKMLLSGNPALQQMALKMAPLFNKVNSVKTVRDAQGRVVHQPIMESGGFASPGQMAVAEKLQALNTGAQTAMVDPFSGRTQETLQNTMTPAQAAQLAQNQRQFNARMGQNQAQFAAKQAAGGGAVDPFEAEKRKYMAREFGKRQAEATVALPGATNTINTALSHLDQLMNHPGLDIRTGLSSYLPTDLVRGSDAANFEALKKQVMGGVYEQAFQSLKGGGQITEKETESIQQARTRMDNATSKEEFIAAANDYKGALQRGLMLLERAAKGDYTPLQEQNSQPVSFEGFSATRIE